jgi:hypothetical protein
MFLYLSREVARRIRALRLVVLLYDYDGTLPLEIAERGRGVPEPTLQGCIEEY